MLVLAVTNARVCCPVSWYTHDLQYVATRSALWCLECTKFVFRRAPPQTPLGELTTIPQTN